MGGKESGEQSLRRSGRLPGYHFEVGCGRRERVGERGLLKVEAERGGGDGEGETDSKDRLERERGRETERERERSSETSLLSIH